ncbi:MAG: substrate-binding domain-containing protein [Chloroflexi bacterium]|nr:substrate-binding domain-containing protein [Chloroflexota bacterium]
MRNARFRSIARWALPLAALASALLAVGCAERSDLIVAAGTTVQDTGLLDVLVDGFEQESGYHVSAVAVGTGQALEMGRRGDADVLLVHAPAAEEEFVAEGYGVNRRLVMHNDFVVVGPADDPAGVRGSLVALAAMRAIYDAAAPFVSRGDDSGTHKLELSLWEELGIDPQGGGRYQEAGQGMGATLSIADQLGTYTISDRGTFLVLQDELDLELLFEGDPRLLNPYHVIQVNPDHVAGVRAEVAKAFAGYLLSDEAQTLIGQFGVVEYGRPLFVPDGGKTLDQLIDEQ